ncbi:FAD-dependent oxidoreductase [uncultured Comamonas sp.]|uniref:NAD(P)/FAD-dependent oxidoreductase n=1 Tax=uncultured Comamonas sp. TaxID=114710 RepID=UPI0025EED0C4|nr:FAD-dependent oxidoreductase [uncultured Comamonas sp.]
MNASRTRASATASASSPSQPPAARRIAVIGAGMAGLACARTLMQAGHDVHVYERLTQAGGRMRSVSGPYGSFDIGAQFFTVRDPRFKQALDTTPGSLRAWSLNSVQTRNAQGRRVDKHTPVRETHWVGMPDMQSLPLAWAAPLWEAGRLHLGQSLRAMSHHIASGSRHSRHQWSLMLDTEDHGPQIAADFDAVVLAVPAPVAAQLLQTAPQGAALARTLAPVEMAPCWAMTLSYPMAAQAGLTTLGPQWNSARSTHERVAWVARESSKPGRAQTERWTIHANPLWSNEHRHDDATRVLSKLQKAFGEITGIRVAPRHASVYLWQHAQTLAPLGRPFSHDPSVGLGLCGDWCLGLRVEDAFVSGLEMGLALA